jgi:hypothetical protein
MLAEVQWPAMIPSMKRRRVAIILIGLLALLIAVPLVQITRYSHAERTLLRAVPSPFSYPPITSEGTNLILSVQGTALPVLLQWSVGREPVWIRVYNALRTRLHLAPISHTTWTNVHQARIAFSVLRERAVSAMPELTNRLSDPDRDIRRYSVHMLGAIGPSIGLDAFHIMTNRLSDADQDVRNDVIWALQFHPQEYPATMLIPVYSAGLLDSYHLARENAQQGFVRLGMTPEAAEKMVAAVHKDTNRAALIISNWITTSQDLKPAADQNARPRKEQARRQ